MGEKREYRRRRRPPEEMELQQRQVRRRSHTDSRAGTEVCRRSSRISTRVGWRRAEECPAERQSGRNGGAEIFW